jgi:RNA polymerase sigma-70 factor (ECF subfamily)
LDAEASRAADDPSQHASTSELTASLARSITEMPDPPRSSFVARVLLGHEYEAIARDLGFEPGTVRIHVMKARRLLAKQLAPFLEDPS